MHVSARRVSTCYMLHVEVKYSMLGLYVCIVYDYVYNGVCIRQYYYYSALIHSTHYHSTSIVLLLLYYYHSHSTIAYSYYHSIMIVY